MNQRSGFVKSNATFDDVLAAPPDRMANLIEGDLYLHPRPRFGHARAVLRLGAAIDQSFGADEGPDGWWIFYEPQLRLGRSAPSPDIAGWRRTSLPDVEADTAWVEIRPDWICEVISPATEAFDRTEKRDLYRRMAVPHLWLLDPISRVLEVFHHSGETWTLVGSHSGDARCRVEPFEALEIDLARLWI